MITGGVGAYFLLNDNDSSNGSGTSSDTVWDSPTVGIDSSTRYSTEPFEKGYSVEYSYSTGQYSFYYIYIGAVNNVPFSWSAPMRYNGITPIEISYSIIETTSGSISTSSSTCITKTVETTVSKEIELNNKVYAGIGLGLMSAGVETGWKATWGLSETLSSSVSKTDTFTSFTGWSLTTTSGYRMTIGEHGESPGYYRYSVFATCDVFATVVVDELNNNYYYDYTTFAREDTFCINPDYSEDGDYTKGNYANALKFDYSTLKDLSGAEMPEDILVLDYSKLDNNTIVGTVLIPVYVNSVFILGDSEKKKNVIMSIVIDSRNVDLKITLASINIVAPEGRTAILYIGNHTDPHTITIELIRDNSVRGGNGSDGKNGSSGAAGSIGIDIGARHSLVVIGTGSLSVVGGNGGNGGSQSGAGANGGNGGAGGNGGYSIKADSAPGQPSPKPLVLKGGIGGNGGAGGSGNNFPYNRDGSAGTSGANALDHHWFDGVKQRSL
jgi:hypothetical protein